MNRIRSCLLSCFLWRDEGSSLQMSSERKLEEAKFFLELLDALDQRSRPLTHSADAAKEASFLFAAVLNSFYSATAIMQESEHIDTKPFTDAHPEIYARAKNGGERAKTVHIAHTDTAFSGYIPPPGDAVNLDFRKTPLLVVEARVPGRVDLVLGPGHYMRIELHDKLVDVCDFCHAHYYQLKKFHDQSKASSHGN